MGETKAASLEELLMSDPVPEADVELSDGKVVKVRGIAIDEALAFQDKSKRIAQHGLARPVDDRGRKVQWSEHIAYNALVLSSCVIEPAMNIEQAALWMVRRPKDAGAVAMRIVELSNLDAELQVQEERAALEADPFGQGS